MCRYALPVWIASAKGEGSGGGASNTQYPGNTARHQRPLLASPTSPVTRGPHLIPSVVDTTFAGVIPLPRVPRDTHE